MIGQLNIKAKRLFVNNKLFSRDDESTPIANKRVSWIDSFADNYQQISNNNKMQSSAYLEDIRQILDNNYSPPKHATVESKVNEYIERTGLGKFLNKDLSNVKKASEDNQENVIEVSSEDILTDISPKLKDKILYFIDNKCKSTEGRLPVAAILDEILSVFSSDGISNSIIGSNDLIKYINQCNNSYKKEISNDYRHLGLDNVQIEDDGSNSDFFHNFNNIK